MATHVHPARPAQAPGGVALAMVARWRGEGGQHQGARPYQEDSWALKTLTDGLGPLAEAGTVEDALAFGDAILLAVPYKAVPQIARDYAPKFAGKVVLDAGNAVAARDGVDLVKETREKGIGNTTAAYLPGAHVVRAFNSMSVAFFIKESHRAGEPMAIPIAGDDAHAVAVAAQLVRDAGFEAVAVPLARAQEFAQGGPFYGKQLTARELRQRFGLAQ